MQNLNVLVMDKNNFKYLPNSIGNLQNLKDLTLGNRNFANFSNVIKKLQNLNILNGTSLPKTRLSAKKLKIKL